MLTHDEIEAYLASISTEQAECIRQVRRLIAGGAPDLIEEVDQGKWFGGLLTYYTADRIHAYALGPLNGGYTTLHMMPYYGSTILQARHGTALKSTLSGKSCIKFKDVSQIPFEAIQDIVASTPQYAAIAREMFEKRKSRSGPP